MSESSIQKPHGRWDTTTENNYVRSLQILGQETIPFTTAEEFRHRLIFRQVARLHGTIICQFPTKGRFLDWVLGDGRGNIIHFHIKQSTANSTVELASDDPIVRILSVYTQEVRTRLAITMYHDDITALVEAHYKPPIWDEPKGYGTHIDIQDPFQVIQVKSDLYYPKRMTSSGIAYVEVKSGSSR